MKLPERLYCKHTCIITPYRTVSSRLNTGSGGSKTAWGERYEGVTFEVPPFSSCELSPTMLLLLETFLELILCNSFQCRRHSLDVFSIMKSSSLLYFRI